MIGKKNVVFGFLFLVTSAALGPYMVDMYDDYGVAAGEKQMVVGKLQQVKAADFAEDPDTLEPMTAEMLAQLNSESILAMNKLGNVEFAIDYIKGGPHAHGNLESVLNILVGLALCFIAAPALLKHLVSWLFILGTLLHSGMLYLERVFGMAIPTFLPGIGAVMILLGLLLAGLTAWKYFSADIVRD